MTGPERGFLLLCSHLGNPERKPLTGHQLRVLSQRVRSAEITRAERELEPADLFALGYGQDMARRIAALLDEEDLLDRYLKKGERSGCYPVTRISGAFPLVLRKRLGDDAPGVLWARGAVELLSEPTVALVGSRDLLDINRRFAEEAGRQAALQGYTLVSGNARGADRTAQDACLEAGGRVISVVADELWKHPIRDNMLYLSEDGFAEAFSAQRALSRNRIIHGLGLKTLVAQVSLHVGGTWDGTVRNLRFGWSPVFCYDDGSEASCRLADQGAVLVRMEDLQDLSNLKSETISFFDQ